MPDKYENRHNRASTQMLHMLLIIPGAGASFSSHLVKSQNHIQTRPAISIKQFLFY